MSRNAYKGGLWQHEREALRDLRRLLRKHQESLAQWRSTGPEAGGEP